MNGGLFYQPDDVADRARAAGKTASEYLREAAARRKARTYAVPSRTEVMERIRAAEERARQAEEELKKQTTFHRLILAGARQEAARERFARSWLNMCLIIQQERLKAQEQRLGSLDERVTVKSILEQVSRQTGFPVSALRSARRFRVLTQARQFVMWRASNETLMSLPQIGRQLGNRDHTTVLHGIRKVQAALDRGEKWALRLVGSIR